MCVGPTQSYTEGILFRDLSPLIPIQINYSHKLNDAYNYYLHTLFLFKCASHNLLKTQNVRKYFFINTYHIFIFS